MAIFFNSEYVGTVSIHLGITYLAKTENLLLKVLYIKVKVS